MPSGHYPFKHRGGYASVVWNWPDRPVIPGFTDDYAHGSTHCDNVFSNILLQAYQPNTFQAFYPLTSFFQYSAAFSPESGFFNLSYPPNPSLPTNWFEFTPYGNGPPVGTFGPTLWLSTSQTTAGRVVRRLQEFRFMWTFGISVIGGAQHIFGTYFRFRVHYIYNTNTAAFPYYQPDLTKLVTVPALPTILRPGDETFMEHTYTQSVTPFAVPGRNGIQNTGAPQSVVDYYTPIYNAVLAYCQSITTMNITARFAATPYSQAFPPQAPWPFAQWT